MMKKIENLMTELRAEVVNRAPMTPVKSFEHYPDITTSIAAGDDYQLLIKNGEKFLSEKYGSKSRYMLVVLERRVRNEIFKRLSD